VIKLASNENPLGPSPKALAAMKAALPNVHLYPDGGGFYLRQGLAKHLGVEMENIILGNGSNEIVEFLAHAFLKPGDNLVCGDRAFVVYLLIGQQFNNRVIEVPFRNHAHDLDAMLRAVTPQTKLVFVANPNNPTGTRVSNAELYRFMERVPDHVIVVLDEAYYEFLDDPPDSVRYVKTGRPKTVLMRTFSKIVGLAGLRIGYGIAPKECIGILQKTRQPFNVNSIVQAGALASLDDREHIERTRKMNVEGRRYLESQFAAMGLEYVPSAANFVLVKVGDGAKVTTNLQRRGIIVRPMGGYKMPEWVRVTVGTREQNERFLSALKQEIAGSR
jgi:histidinol-phosphate aminotransferase